MTRAFRHRVFALLWSQALLSNTGTWVQNVAQAWWVLVLTRSPFMVGLVTFANFIPAALLSPLGGALADRRGRRRVLLATQSTMMLLALGLGLSVLAGSRSPWAVVGVAFGMGVAMAFNGPAWQALLPTLVPREDLVAAVSLNSVQWNLARVVGPALGGLVLQVSGPGWAFLLNAASFLGVIAILARMTEGDRPSAPVQAGGAWTLVASPGRVRRLLAFTSAVAGLGAPFLTVLPAFARADLGTGARGYGFLLAAVGAGATVGAFGVDWLLARFPSSSVGIGAAGSFALSLALLASSPGLGSAAAACFWAGAGYLASQTVANSGIQLSVPDHIRGRVMSAYIVAFFGFFALGSLGVGALAGRIGSRPTLVMEAVLLGLASLPVAAGLERSRTPSEFLGRAARTAPASADPENDGGPTPH